VFSRLDCVRGHADCYHSCRVAAGDVERKGKPLIHTHLLLLPSAAAPSLAPLPWPVQDQTTAARATSGYYDTIQATLQALQGGSSSSSSGSSRRKDGASTVTLLQKRDTAHALPGAYAWGTELARGGSGGGQLHGLSLLAGKACMFFLWPNLCASCRW
jgi:hypothetical protein